jgi:hypothetical protein
MTDREVITRPEAAYIFSLEDSDFTTYLSAEHAQDYAKGKVSIPPMPHIPGRPVKFVRASLREWILNHLQVTGDEPKRRKSV